MWDMDIDREDNFKATEHECPVEEDRITEERDNLSSMGDNHEEYYSNFEGMKKFDSL